MHLLATTEAPRHDLEPAVDLEQSPGEIVILSAADTELASLAAAAATLGDRLPSVRLASLASLAHPLSVDLYIERTLAGARLVIVRALGGTGYWRYLLEQLTAATARTGAQLVALPGDAHEDEDLARLSTIPTEPRRRLWRYLVEGGPENAASFLLHAAHLIGRGPPAPEPRVLPSAGLHRATPGPAHRPPVPVVFYKALYQAGDLAAIDALIDALATRGCRGFGLWVTSLKDPAAAAFVDSVLRSDPPALILATTGFAVGSPENVIGGPLERAGCPVLQVVLAGTDAEAWRDGSRGLGPRDLAMHVALPEIDGRVLSRAVAFKSGDARDPGTEYRPVVQTPEPDRVAFVAELASAWVRLRATPRDRRRVAIVLANYPDRDGRIANGVGLDTPASCTRLLATLRAAGYAVEGSFADGDALVRALQAGPTNDLRDRHRREVQASLPLAHYRAWLATIPEAPRAALLERWGDPEDDPHVGRDAFALSVLPLRNGVIGLQPARGYQLDPTATYHDPALVPPHGYLAFYVWLREVWGAHAIVHLGKHGNLEWLPGKATALSATCWPELALGPLPHLYPFIVNDPGEGTQAKRRASAVIVDHLTPPLTRAEGHGELLELERLLDEHADAYQLDPRRVAPLRREIDALTARLGLDRDLRLEDRAADDRLVRLDAHLCELKELQIRDGLHVFGAAPEGEQLTDLVVALARLPRLRGAGADASLHRVLAADLGLDGFDPLTADLAAPWSGPRPAALRSASDDPWRTAGDTVERIELLARILVAGEMLPEPGWTATRVALEGVVALRAAVLGSGPAETASLLAGLDGRFVPPGPSGAPTRGRPDVLPTGRNFYSVDTRAVPTPAAWRLGWASAEAVLEHYLAQHGEWPRAIALSAWGTSCMRTGGDDIAQALALLGCRPVWDDATGRVTGVEVLPAAVIDRPRVDVTLRVSGLFRDAFPAQVELFDDAVRAVAALEEPATTNPLAAEAEATRARLLASGIDDAEARRRAALRIFSSPPGTYGAGLQALIDGGGWEGDAELAGAFLAWGGHAYGRGVEGVEARGELGERLERVELVLHNQDNREHDLLDSDDYYQFEGGLAATVRHLSGRQPEVLHADHSRPERPRVRPLEEEIGLVVRGRAANPKWIAGVMRHGYKGAFEIAATVDYLFAFAATARVVSNEHFAALFDAYLGDERVRGFMAEANPAALRETADRFAEAIRRGLWRPQRNSVTPLLDELRAAA